MFNRIASFSSVLVSAVHKSTAPVLYADAVATAAEKYASNAGAKNLITAVATACIHTDSGAVRKIPADGTKAHSLWVCTPAYLILASMNAILSRADAIGARPGTGTQAERSALSAEFGDTIRAEYCASVEAASVARKNINAKPDAASEAASVAPSDTGDSEAVTVEAVGPTADADTLAIGAVCTLDAREFVRRVNRKQLDALATLVTAAQAAFAATDATELAAVTALVQESAASVANAAKSAKRERKGREALAA